MRTVLRAIANRPYETTVAIRNRGGVVGAVCNRPLGVAVHADGVAGDYKSPLRDAVLRAIINRPYETTVAIRKRGGHTKTRWSYCGAMLRRMRTVCTFML